MSALALLKEEMAMQTLKKLVGITDALQIPFVLRIFQKTVF
jgi:hypothetical protein